MKKLRFSLNKKLDKEIIVEFLGVKQGGIDFGNSIITLHPKLKLSKSLNLSEKEKFVSSYIDAYYRDYGFIIRHDLSAIRDSWRQREKEFITVTTNIFQGFSFPPGRYIAFVSIVDCNPRFLETKTFQIYYKKSIPDAVYTIAHELLHFVFFDFVKKRLAREIKDLPDEQLWDLSEIFNVVILKLPRYRNIIDHTLIVPYPNHYSLLAEFKIAYQNSQDIEGFIRSGVDILTKKKS